MDLDKRKPEIEYPCDWNYKIIGSDVGKMVETVEAIFSEVKYDLQASNISKKGKYKSLSIKVEVENEALRNKFFDALSKSENIKIVI